MLKRSDGTQEESTTLNTFLVGGGITRQTHTNRKHLGYIYFDELTGADETYARTHNINDIQLQTTTWVKEEIRKVTRQLKNLSSNY